MDLWFAGIDDTEWNNSANWWEDSAKTSAHGATPDVPDTAFLTGTDVPTFNVGGGAVTGLDTSGLDPGTNVQIAAVSIALGGWAILGRPGDSGEHVIHSSTCDFSGAVSVVLQGAAQLDSSIGSFHLGGSIVYRDTALVQGGMNVVYHDGALIAWHGVIAENIGGFTTFDLSTVRFQLYRPMTATTLTLNSAAQLVIAPQSGSAIFLAPYISNSGGSLAFDPSGVGGSRRTCQ